MQTEQQVLSTQDVCPLYTCAPFCPLTIMTCSGTVNHHVALSVFCRGQGHWQDWEVDSMDQECEEPMAETLIGSFGLR
jgi:hypothetical protein